MNQLKETPRQNSTYFKNHFQLKNRMEAIVITRVLVFFTKNYNDRVKENGIGEICSTNKKRETSQKNFFSTN